ncbi:MAG: GGDEF domain-containing protein [Lachnospirales bacterium]
MYRTIIDNFITLTIIFGMAIQLMTNKVFDKKIQGLFTMGLTAIFLLVFIDAYDYNLSQQDSLSNIRYLSTIIGYILRPTALVVFIFIIYREKKNTFYIWIPLIIEILILITTPFTHIAFYFDESNIFHRGILGFMPHIVSALYLLFLIYSAGKIYRHVDIREIITVVFIIVICVTATILESFMGEHFVLPGAMASSCTVYYIYLYVQIYKVDVMTGLLNRRSFYNDSLKYENVNMAIISVDLDGLKKINDSGGHAAGDIAIKTVANILVAVAKKDFRVYRTGGDEFIILGIRKDSNKALKYIEDIKKEIDLSEYSISCGFALYKEGDNFDVICAEADMNMYEDKKRRKMKLLEV